MNKDSKDLKKFPAHKSDDDARKFTSEADLSEYDFSDFKPVQFEFQKKTARLELRLPEAQLAALNKLAEQQGIPAARLVRHFIEQGMQAQKS